MIRPLTQPSATLFKGRRLYSRYDPEKAILGVIDALILHERTLVLCFSPAACYGLEALVRKLPPHCAILCIEAEPELYDGAKSALQQLNPAPPVSLIGPQDMAAFIPHRIHELGVFRSVVRVDMSGGVGFHASLYAQIHRVVHTAISRFWQNRLTLTRLGRLYALNLFRNLRQMGSIGAVELPLGQIRRAILVAGAGPGMDELDAPALAHFFVVAVDMALSALLARKVRVDMAVQLESQQAIDQAYVGMRGGTPFLAALALTARNTGARQSGARIGFFSTPYTEARFLKRLLGELPQVPPLGSVGLAAVHLALQCRAGPEVPVYAAGLDFSFSAGVTHCKGSPQQRGQHFSADRLHPAGDAGAAFAPGAALIEDKNGRPVYSTVALKGYCESFKAVFGGTPALYDAGESGLDLGIERRKPESEIVKIEDLRQCGALSQVLGALRGVSPRRGGSGEPVGVGAWGRLPPPTLLLQNEITALQELRAILTGECRAAEGRVYDLLREHEYLFLHFPDGWDVTPERAQDRAFLKRVRGEIDCFLKAMGAGARRA